ATLTLRFFPRDVVVTSIFARRDGRRSRSMRARNGRTVLLNLSPNRRRISPVTRSIEISSSPRAAQSIATVSAAGYSSSRSAILKPYSDSLSATHCASTDSAPTLRSGARAGKSSWFMDTLYARAGARSRRAARVRWTSWRLWRYTRGLRRLRERAGPDSFRRDHAVRRVLWSNL